MREASEKGKKGENILDLSKRDIQKKTKKNKWLTLI